MPSVTGRSWLDIRIQTENENRNAVRNKIMGWPEEVAQKRYWPALQQIGRNGVQFQRSIIERLDRIDTGDMKRGVKMRANKRAGNAFTLFVGWVDGRPGYSIFQEHGTRSGVVAMDSIAQTREYMLSQIEQLARGGRVEAADTSFQGNESSN